MNKVILTTILFVTSLSLSVSQPSSADAKKYTIYDRQVKLMQIVNKAQKDNQLTEKEAHKMRKKLASIARQKKKMIRKNDENTLSNENKVKLEKELNDISLEIKKLMLEKRVEAQKKKAE